MTVATPARSGIEWPAVWAIVERDLRAVRRSKAVVLPMMLVPFLLLVVLPFVVGFAAPAVKLAAAGGKKSEAAKILGISRVTLWKRLKAFGIGIDPSGRQSNTLIQLVQRSYC